MTGEPPTIDINVRPTDVFVFSFYYVIFRRFFVLVLILFFVFSRERKNNQKPCTQLTYRFPIPPLVRTALRIFSCSYVPRTRFGILKR